jgi:hypothetical protein
MKHRGHHVPPRMYLPHTPQKLHAMQERVWKPTLQKPQTTRVVRRNQENNERTATR